MNDLFDARNKIANLISNECYEYGKILAHGDDLKAALKKMRIEGLKAAKKAVGELIDENIHMDKLQIKIKENKMDGEIFSYHLQTNRGYGVEIMDTQEMRQIAAVLIAKAGEIDGNEKNNAIIKNWFAEITKAEKESLIEGRLDQDSKKELQTLLRDKRKITAIKLVKRLTSSTLAESKDYINCLEKRINNG